MIRVWDATTASILVNFADSDSSYATAFLLDTLTDTLVVGSTDFTCKVWNYHDQQVRHMFSGHGGTVTSIAVVKHPLQRHDTHRHHHHHDEHHPEDPTEAAVALAKAHASSAALTTVATAAADGSLMTWDLTSGKRLQTVVAPPMDAAAGEASVGSGLSALAVCDGLGGVSWLPGYLLS